uniref:3-dehydrosphinganine reductase n=1 Tax=Albugo laibachii Nc14 TaxID=890382 RepID=F0WJB3_9STRA|nr:conserved hypothetical protein [Albugo laibachii Nc14]|eukprot:CCA21360.1 conserved hypothetical protein [Albugo laibachii Nc14]
MSPNSDLAATEADSTPATAGTNKVDTAMMLDDITTNSDRVCSECDQKVADTDDFCIFCGTKVGSKLQDISKQVLSSPTKDTSTKKPSEEDTSILSKEASTTEEPVQKAFFDSNEEAPTVKEPIEEMTKKEETPPVVEPIKTTKATSPRSTIASGPANNKPTADVEAGSLNLPRSSNSIDDRFSTSFLGSSAASLEQLWVPDNFSSNCMDCKSPFGFPKPRRHHCRVCGLLFCRNCLQNKVVVPKSFGYGENKERCCRNCVTALQVKSISSPADVFNQRKSSHQIQSQANRQNSNHAVENQYEILGVTKNASAKEIQNQFHSMSSSEKDQEVLTKLQDAYETLQNPSKRQEHDTNIDRSQNSMLGESCSFQSNPTEMVRSDQTECQVCYRPFKFGRRQHHCRRCTRSVCNNCSEGMKPILELGFPQPVRHCSTCMTKPPSFIQPVMDPVTKPPAGFEYLTRMDICVSVTQSKDEDMYEIKTYCEPNEAILKEMKYTLTETERAVANDYRITHPRTLSDFEWLVTAMGNCTNIKALPFFPDRRAIRNERDRGASGYQGFIVGCLLHPLLRDSDCLKSFLVLPPKELTKYRSSSKPRPLYENEKYENVITALRLEFERAQVRRRIDLLNSRKEAHEKRMEEQKERLNQQRKREAAQIVRRENATTRFRALEARKESETERMEREKSRFLQQAEATHILYFDKEQDAFVRNQEEENLAKEKIEFTKSKDMFQSDTTEWNTNMALWSKHRANWSEHHNPAVSKDIANEWILKFYGIYYSKVDNINGTEGIDAQVPPELVKLHAKMVELQEQEPGFLDEEGTAVDDEWSKLAKEREHWASDRANMKREDEMCKDEDVRYKQEHEYVSKEVEAREAKIAVVEKDMQMLQQQIHSRHKIIAQRLQRHQALDQEFEKEWQVSLKNRTNGTKIRLGAHQTRISRTEKRCELFLDQLQRQQQSQRMLLFKRATLLEERSQDTQMFEEHQEDSHVALEACQNARALTPEYINRMEADMKNRSEELKSVMESNKPTSQEGGDLDERDGFMNKVRQQRTEYQNELKQQLEALEREGKLCVSLLERIQKYQAALDEEIEDGAIEDTLIANFVSLKSKEEKLLKEEEVLREEKKRSIQTLINDAGTWVLKAIHEHSKRKKEEASRLVGQAQRAAELQKLVQHFTHRVIDQEERIMRQKQRIINCEHKIEMLKAADNWYEYVMEILSPDFGKKDGQKLEAGRIERMEDLKEAARLQKEDESDMKKVATLLEACKQYAVSKEEKRAIWAKVEEVYSVTKAQEKEEDLMMTSQIRDLLQQLGEAFEMLTNRLLEEEESLQHASNQLEGEIESIKSFMERMEKEESTLGTAEKSSLAKESQVNRSESDLIKQRARTLIETYKQMHNEHQNYPIKAEKIQQRRSERPGPGALRVSEMEAVKKIIKTRNYYDARACGEFARKFKIDQEMKEARHVLDWFRKDLDQIIRDSELWAEASRKDRKQIEGVKLKAAEMDWDHDTLSKIPALLDVQKKLSDKKSNASQSSDRRNANRTPGNQDGVSVHPDEQWLVELIDLKRKISDLDAIVLKNIGKMLHTAKQDEKAVVANLQQMKNDKEYILNTLRFIDQEEARAIRLAGKVSFPSQRNLMGHEESGSEEVETPRSIERSASSSKRFTPRSSKRDKTRQEASKSAKNPEETVKSQSEESVEPGKLPDPARRTSSTAAASNYDYRLCFIGRIELSYNHNCVLSIRIFMELFWGFLLCILALAALSFAWSKFKAPGFDVAGKHVFITGGTSGLGLSLAKKYAIAGAKVSIIGRSTEKLDNAKCDIEAVQKPGQPVVFSTSCDVTKLKDVEDTISAANRFHERATDYVICNAGSAEPGYFLAQDMSVFRRMMDLNYFGVVHTVKAALPAMIERDEPAHIVIVSSACALISFIGYTQYCASKYAVRGFAEALRSEMLLYKIKVHVFYPGSIDTPGFVEENRTKPQETSTIEGSSTLHHPDNVAQSLIHGVKSGKFSFTNEPILDVLRLIANGISPRENSAVEFLLMPFCFLFQVIYLFYMDYVVFQSGAKATKSKSQ